MEDGAPVLVPEQRAARAEPLQAGQRGLFVFYDLHENRCSITWTAQPGAGATSVRRPPCPDIRAPQYVSTSVPPSPSCPERPETAI